MASTALMLGGVARWLIVLGAVVYFWTAATYEERKFARSPVAKEYGEYMLRTGRFVPRVLAT